MSAQVTAALYALSGFLISSAPGVLPVRAETWTSITVKPGQIALASPGKSQHIVVSATNSSGLEKDVTGICQMQSSNPEVVSVDQNHGLITGRSSGRAEVRVSLGNTTALAKVTVSDKSAEVAVRFSPDVISVLTIKGCNGSGCHGSPAGQSGFKLSLFGYDVAADHNMIVGAHNGRRVNLDKPQESLLLRKPSFEIPHGGGRLFSAQSEEYRTILKWLEQGAKLDSDGVHITRLELFPSERVLVGAGSKQRLAVIGHLSDGTTRDMTREVRYTTADDSIATVTSDGTVSAMAQGLTSVLARGMGQVAAGQIGVITVSPGADYPSVKGNNFIDDLVFAKLRKMNVVPAPITSDAEFLRRAYLDTIGLLPSPSEYRAFVRDSRPDKRSRLIDMLLDRPEYVSYWTVKFEDWFRNCQLNSQGRSMGKFKEWTRDWIAQDRPYDHVVRELLTSEGDTFLNPGANFWHPATDFMLKKFDVNKVTPTVSRLFLGIRLECAECHNHPLENFTQDDFYGLSAFFARLRVKHGHGEYRRTWFLEEEGEVQHPVTKKPVHPKFLAAGTPAIPQDGDRRAVLADWIVAPENPYFARATVNRIWHEYLDVGIVEPFDDFRSTNMPTNRELLNRLARYFVDSGFRLKALHRIILNSRTYQLSSQHSGKARESTPLERLLFARYQPRKLGAEVLLDSISGVTGVAHPFKGYPAGTRAMDLYVPDAPDYFLVAFGLPRRDILADRSKTPTMSQALHLMNGETVLQKVRTPDNILKELLSKHPNDANVISDLYERAYSRPPSEAEISNVLTYLASEREAGRTRRRAFEGLLWAILNSKEFQLNH